jgi:hypothetical protein
MFQLELFSATNNGVWGRMRKDTAILNAAGDIVSNKKYIHHAVGNYWTLFQTSVYIYSEYSNPLARLSNFKSFPVFPAGDDYYHGFFQQHNIVTYINNVYAGPPSASSNVTLNYKFDTGGLPIQSENYWPNDHIKLGYKYKNL